MLYRLLDTSPAGRIIKDVMRHQSGEERKRKKPPVLSETGSQGQAEAPEVLIDDDIDPADFLDPEEFGFRRRGSNAPRP